MPCWLRRTNVEKASLEEEAPLLCTVFDCDRLHRCECGQGTVPPEEMTLLDDLKLFERSLM